MSERKGPQPRNFSEADRARARYTIALPRYRSEWLNLHLGGHHWVHNDLTDWNLRATHSCPTCHAFRRAAFQT